MAKDKIPVYDICSINKNEIINNDLLIDRFSSYLAKHYHQLHFPHGHTFYHLVLFTKGAGTHSVDFTKFDVKPFQIYFMIPGQVHSWNFEGEMDGYIINFSDDLYKSFLLNPNYLERFNFFNGISEDAVFQLPDAVQPPIIDLFEKMITLAKPATSNDVDMIRLLLLQVLILIDNTFANPNNNVLPQQKLLLLKGFRKLIEQQYRSIRLPKEYADLLYVTPNHLNALCQDVLNKTAGELIRDRVLLEAKRLLTNAKMTIAEIAYDLNFQDNSYFNRFFKKYTGQTPDEFRKQFK